MRIIRTMLLVVIILGTFMMTGNSAYAAVTLYTDLASWQTALANAGLNEEVFLTSLANVEQAEEITPPLLPLQPGLGDTWTYLKNSTGLSRDFSLRSLSPGTELRFVEAFGGIIEFAQAVAGANASNDDWLVSVSNGPLLQAFGIVIHGNVNGDNTGETLSLLAEDDTVLATFNTGAIIPFGSMQFLGVIADFNFAKVKFDEADDPQGDDHQVGIFRFATPSALAFACSGFEAPMNTGPVTVKKNRVLPLKAQLFNSENNLITDADIAALPVIQVLFDSGIAPAIDVTDDALSAGQGTEGNEFVFEDGKWRFNLKTKNYTAQGTYTITMQSGDTNMYTINPTCTAQFVIE